MNESPIELLDLVLLKISINTNRLMFGEILSLVENINERELNQILSKLIKDEYVNTDRQTFMNANFTVYYISFEGSVLIQTGGYKQKIKDHQGEKRKDFRNGVWSTVLSGIGGALLGAVLTISSQWFQSQPQTNTVVLPKIQLIRDTVYVKVPEDKKK